jgi:opacity protein-like surface antigen
MLKKIALLGAAACLATSTAMASGLYVGAGIGYQGFNVSVPEFSGSNAARVYGDGAVGNFFVGYEFCFGNNFALAAEFNVMPTGAKFTESDGDTTKHTYSLGVNAKPAIYVGERTKVFGTIGWQNGEFKDSGTQGTDFPKKNLNAFYYGGGMEMPFPFAEDMEQLSLRFEYAHAQYAKWESNDTTRSSKPRTDSFMASVVYNMGDFL